MNPSDANQGRISQTDAQRFIPVAEKAGDRIGGYHLLQQIGEGGCGVVYVAEQVEPVRRRVALKIVKLGMDTKMVIARFEAERQALALMDHPNICKVLDAGATETGRPFFVMELVRGISITGYCDQNKLSTDNRLKLFLQVCRGIQHAHERHIIHRDIKPSNILVTMQDGEPVPKIIDFGIAKATTGQPLTDKTIYTAFEQFIGTPAYMSPEQAELSGLELDVRSDIYSLGVLLYELLTDEPPFESRLLLQAGLEQMRRIIREQEPVRPSTRLTSLEANILTGVSSRRSTEPPRLVTQIRGDLDWIVMRCLEKNRQRRYESADVLASDIRRHLEAQPVSARPPSIAYRLEKTLKKHKLLAGASLALSFIVLVCLAVTFHLWKSQNNFQRRQIIAETTREQLQLEAEYEGLNEESRALRNQGKQAEALKKLEQVLAVSIKVYGATNPRTLDVLYTLADTSLAVNNSTNALLYAEKCLAARSVALPGEDRNLLRTRHMLGRCYSAVNRKPAAIKILEDVLRTQSLVFGTNDMDAHWTMGDLASVCLDEGKVREAIALFESDLAFKKIKLGRGAGHTQWLARRLIDAYARDDRLNDAFSIYKELAAPLDVQAYDNTPLEALISRPIGAAFRTIARAGRQEAALKLSEKALAQSKKAFGASHPETIAMMSELVAVEAAIGASRQASKHAWELSSLDQKDASENSYNDFVIGLTAKPHFLPLVLDSEAGTQLWYFRNDQPATNWKEMGFSTIGWSDGAAPFGNGQYAKRTTWIGKKLWLRKSFLLDSVPEAPLVFRVKLDDKVIIWLNDVKAAEFSAWGPMYRLHACQPTAQKSLRIGTNVLCVVAINTLGPGVADVGLYADVAPEKYRADLNELFAGSNSTQGGDARVWKTLFQLGVLFRDGQRFAEAESVFRERLNYVRSVNNTNEIGNALGSLARTLLTEQKFAEAESNLYELIALNERSHPKAYAFSARGMLAESFVGQKKFEEAEPLLLAIIAAGRKQAKETLPPDLPNHFVADKNRMRQMIALLVQLYETTGRSELALSWKGDLKALDALDQKKLLPGVSK